MIYVLVVLGRNIKSVMGSREESDNIISLFGNTLEVPLDNFDSIRFEFEKRVQENRDKFHELLELLSKYKKWIWERFGHIQELENFLNVGFNKMSSNKDPNSAAWIYVYELFNSNVDFKLAQSLLSDKEKEICVACIVLYLKTKYNVFLLIPSQKDLIE
jgi:hypothetical protein